MLRGFSSQLYPQYLEQCPTHSSDLINTCSMNWSPILIKLYLQMGLQISRWPVQKISTSLNTEGKIVGKCGVRACWWAGCWGRLWSFLTAISDLLALCRGHQVSTVQTGPPFPMLTVGSPLRIQCQGPGPQCRPHSPSGRSRQQHAFIFQTWTKHLWNAKKYSWSLKVVKA